MASRLVDPLRQVTSARATLISLVSYGGENGEPIHAGEAVAVEETIDLLERFEDSIRRGTFAQNV